MSVERQEHRALKTLFHKLEHADLPSSVVIELGETIIVTMGIKETLELIVDFSRDPNTGVETSSVIETMLMKGVEIVHDGRHGHNDFVIELESFDALVEKIHMLHKEIHGY